MVTDSLGFDCTTHHRHNRRLRLWCMQLHVLGTPDNKKYLEYCRFGGKGINQILILKRWHDDTHAYSDNVVVQCITTVQLQSSS